MYFTNNLKEKVYSSLVSKVMNALMTAVKFVGFFQKKNVASYKVFFLCCNRQKAQEIEGI